MHAPEAGRVEPRAVPERGADDGVVGRRHVLEHVELRGDELDAVVGAAQQPHAAAAAPSSGQRASSPARSRCTRASATAPTTGARPGTGARRDARLRRASSAATAVRRCADSARSRSPPCPGRIGLFDRSSCVPHRRGQSAQTGARRAARPRAAAAAGWRGSPSGRRGSRASGCRRAPRRSGG